MEMASRLGSWPAQPALLLRFLLDAVPHLPEPRDGDLAPQEEGREPRGMA